MKHGGLKFALGGIDPHPFPLGSLSAPHPILVIYSFYIIKYIKIYILSRASEAGSPKNRLGSRPRRDTDQ